MNGQGDPPRDVREVYPAVERTRRWLHRMGHHHGHFDQDCQLCQKGVSDMKVPNGRP